MTQLFDEDITILFSSEDHNNRLKSWGESHAGGYIYEDLRVSVRDQNNAPETAQLNGKTYRKIPVDLNEGAGGKFLYLYYAKTSYAYETLFGIDVLTGWVPNQLKQEIKDETIKLGLSLANNTWIDLNQGAGGEFVNLVGKSVLDYLKLRYSASRPVLFSGYVILDIAIISTTKKITTNNYAGWHLIPTDLNKSAGGKYIYLCYLSTYVDNVSLPQ